MPRSCTKLVPALVPALLLAGCAVDRRALPEPDLGGVGSGWQFGSSREIGPGGGDASRIMLLVGMRSLDESDWDPVDDQPMVGIDVSYEPEDSGVGVELGGSLSSERDERPGDDISSGLREVHAGLRRTFARRSRLQPYIGFGASVVYVDVGGIGATDRDDQTFAGYVRGGLVYFVSDGLFLGVDVRTLYGSDVDLDGVPGDVDFTQFALTFGGAL